MPRYQILESTSLVDIFWGDVGVRVKDTETGNSARATAKNTADAERQAWDKLKEKQGPSPSEMR